MWNHNALFHLKHNEQNGSSGISENVCLNKMHKVWIIEYMTAFV